MVKKLVAGLLAIFVLVNCNTVNRLVMPPTPTPPLDVAEAEYAVYSALIEASYATNKLGMIVIQDHTGLGVSGNDPQQFAYLRKSLPEVDQPLLDDFQARNVQSEPIEDRFTLKTQLVLISQDEVTGLFGQGGGAWDEFYKKYPNSQGLMTLSKVGFNAAGDKALVYVGNQSHFLAGAGFAVVLGKKNGVWTILNQVMLWIS
jgi:hypothetical protein